MEAPYGNRIDFTGDLQKISEAVCKDFELGTFVEYRIIPIGYEDFNFHLKTTNVDFFVKIFSKMRTQEECKRIVDVMAKSLEAGIKIPELFKSRQGYLHTIKTDGTTLRLCVMEFIDGKDLFTSKTPVSQKDVKELASQASLINSLKIKPKTIYDSWAIVNFPQEFSQKNAYLDRDDLQILKPLLADYENIQIKKLPHCFVHGDIIRTNVIKDGKGGLWIIDFSVSNYYPRIQEIAVLACDVLFDRNSETKSRKNLALALKEYQKKIKLTDREMEILPTYIKLAHAMHVLRANYEKKVNSNSSKENDYFLETGKIGLRRMLKK